MTTPTTQREADERAQFDKAYDDALDKGLVKMHDTRSVAYLGWHMARAAIDQPRAGQVDEHIAGVSKADIQAMAKSPHNICRQTESNLRKENARLHAIIDGLTPTAPQATSQQAETCTEPSTGRRWVKIPPYLAPQATSQQAASIRTLEFVSLMNAWRNADPLTGPAAYDAITAHIDAKLRAPQAATTASAAALQAATSLDQAARRVYEAAYDFNASKFVLGSKEHHAAAHEYQAAQDNLIRVAIAAPAQAAQPALPASDLHTLRRVIECVEKLDERPRPMCRDCADENGTCPNSGLECDMPALIASAKGIYNRLAAPGAAQTTVARGRALEEAAQMCEQQEFSDGDTRARSVAKGCAAAIRALKSDRATHPTDKGQSHE